MNRFLKSVPQVQAYCLKLAAAPEIAVDTETTGLKVITTDKCLGMSFAKNSTDGTFFFVPPVKQRKELLKLLRNPSDKILFNAKFDLHALRGVGFEVGGMIYDCYVMAKLLNENLENHRLKPLAAMFFDPSAAAESDALKEWLAQRGKTFSDLTSAPPELLGLYGANDARITMGLYHALKKGLEEAKIPWSMVERESKVQRIAFEMESKGVRVNQAFLSRYKKLLTAQQNELMFKMKQYLPPEITVDKFNPESGDQVARVMASLGWTATRVTTSGKDAVDKQALEGFDHAFTRVLREHRRLGTIRGTFVEGILDRAIKGKDGWIVHTNYNTAGARTGRWSSSDPNLQNVDKKSEARQGIVPRDGTEFWSFDFKQIEPVIFAHHTRSARLIKVFHDGLDYHKFNASLAYSKPYEEVSKQERDSTKALGLAIMYQAGAAKAASMMGVPLEQGRAMLAAYYAAIPEAKALQRSTAKAIEDRAEFAAKAAGRLTIRGRYEWEYDGKMLPTKDVPWQGKTLTFVEKDSIEEYGWIKNSFGRKRRLRMEESYKGLNALIQSDAGDLLKEAMIRVARIPLLQVHDELVFELPKKGAKAIAVEIKKAMESVQEFFPDVPIRVDVARSVKSWAQEEEVKL